MPRLQDSTAGGTVGAIVAVVFTVLAIASAIFSTYLAGLWANAALGWIYPLFIGGLVTMVLFVVAMIGAAFAMGETRTRRVGIAAVALVLAGLAGGVYGGCRKGFHDSRCHSECSEFW
jgi:hypothetical protein